MSGNLSVYTETLSGSNFPNRNWKVFHISQWLANCRACNKHLPQFLMDQLIVWGKLNRRYHFSRPARWGLGGYNVPQRPRAQADQLDVISRRLETMARSTHKAFDVRFCVTWYLRWKLLEARLTPSQPSSITFGHGKLWAGVEQAAPIVSRVLTLSRGTF